MPPQADPFSIALVNPPYRASFDTSVWVTVPPQGYGGIQWVVSHLIDGLIAGGHTIYLLGAPGSEERYDRLHVVDCGDLDEICRWLRTESSRVDIIHDHTNGQVPLRDLGIPFISTHHLTGRPKVVENTVYLSVAQRAAAGSTGAPVIRIPVNPSRYQFRNVKTSWLLTLSRVSRWKGVLEAAQFAAAAGVQLHVAGPSWEPDYAREIRRDYVGVVRYLGEVGGAHRRALLAEARAVLVLSQPFDGPWGDIWSEPGATVVSEAAVSGTAVISSDNGCLPEIVPLVGAVIPCGKAVTPNRARALLEALPSAQEVHATAVREWGHLRIAAEYTALYAARLGGLTWL